MRRIRVRAQASAVGFGAVGVGSNVVTLCYGCPFDAVASEMGCLRLGEGVHARRQDLWDGQDCSRLIAGFGSELYVSHYTANRSAF